MTMISHFIAHPRVKEGAQLLSLVQPELAIFSGEFSANVRTEIT